MLILYSLLFQTRLHQATTKRYSFLFKLKLGAAALGLHYSTLRYRMKRLRIKKPQRISQSAIDGPYHRSIWCDILVRSVSGHGDSSFEDKKECK